MHQARLQFRLEAFRFLTSRALIPPRSLHLNDSDHYARTTIPFLTSTPDNAWLEMKVELSRVLVSKTPILFRLPVTTRKLDNTSYGPRNDASARVRCTSVLQTHTLGEVGR